MGLRIVHALFGLALAGAGLPDVLAQAYPAKPVRGIVAFAAGGQSDVVARIIAQKLSERWNQSVVIDNRAGANGNIGTEAAAKAAPDGYTLYFPTSTLTVNAVIAPNPSFDVMKAFAPITLTGLAETVLVVTPSLPVHSVKELVNHAKSNPGKLNYGTTSIGASGHIGIEQLKSITGIDMQLVPYTAIINLISDLLAGRIQVFMTPPASVIAHLQSGKLRALGVTGTKRLPILKDVPAITESFPDFRASSWYALLAPAGTPRDVISKINADTRWVLEQADVRQKLAKTGVEAAFSTSEALRAHMLREIANIEKLVQSGSLKKQ